MFPKNPRLGTTSQAEILLFRKFEKQLPNTYHIHHSVSWQLRNPMAGIRNGETDFVIIDPSKGLLVLEVKGGKDIFYNRDTGYWYRNKEEMKDDPFLQGVKTTKETLLPKLKELFGYYNYYHVNNAVAFPDAEVKSDNLRLDMHDEIILDIRDVDNLHQWVDNFFRYVIPETKASYFKYDDEALNALDNALSPSLRFSQPITQYFASLNRVVSQLTQEQYRIINDFRKQRQIAIPGCAGSGKTLIAVEKAIRLENEGYKVLILCHNPYLAEYISTLVKLNKKTNIRVFSFAAYVYALIGDANQKNINLSGIQQSAIKPWTHYDEPTEDELLTAYSRLKSYSSLADAIIIDEGQDFREDWWVIVEESLNDKQNGILYVFFDDNQVTFPLGSGLKQNKIPLSQINLSKNCRNAGEIYEIVRKLYLDAPEVNELLAGEGVVREYLYSSDDRVYEQIRNALIEAENYSNDLHKLKNIVVISAQNPPVNNHKINGLIFNTPSLEKSSQKGKLEWQEAVLYYLNSYSFPKTQLSKNPVPTDDDIRAVSKWCNRYGIFKNPPPLIWYIDIYGKLRLKAVPRK